MNAIILNSYPPEGLNYSAESAAIKVTYMLHPHVVSAGVSYLNVFYEEIFMEYKDKLEFVVRFLEEEPMFKKHFNSADEVLKIMRDIKRNSRKGKQAIVAYNKMFRALQEMYRLTVEERVATLKRHGFLHLKDLNDDLHILQCEPGVEDPKYGTDLMKRLMLLSSPEEPVIDGGFCHVLYDTAAESGHEMTLSKVEICTLPNVNTLSSEQILGVKSELMTEDLGWKPFAEEQFEVLRSLGTEEATHFFDNTPAWDEVLGKLRTQMLGNESIEWIQKTFENPTKQKVWLGLMRLEDLWKCYNDLHILPDELLEELREENKEEMDTVVPVWLIDSIVPEEAEGLPAKRKTLDID